MNSNQTKILWHSLLSGSGLTLIYLNTGSKTISLASSPQNFEKIWRLPSFIQLIILMILFIGVVHVITLISIRILQQLLNQSKEEIENKASSFFLPLCLGWFILLQFCPHLTLISPLFVLLGAELEGIFVVLVFAGMIVSIIVSIIPICKTKIKPIIDRNFKRLNVQRFIPIILFIFSFIFYFIISSYLPGLNGDEPHYLLIVQSLIKDHDLDVNNNYVDRDYNEYISGTLDRHVSIGLDGTRYSTHPVGLAFILAPAYYLGGYKGVLIFLNALAALLSVQLFLLTSTILKKRRWCYYIWFLISFSPPLLPYSSKVFPELPAALAVAYAYRIINDRLPLHIWRQFFLCLALISLPWLQQRFIILSVFMLLLLVFRSGKHIGQWLSAGTFLSLSLAGLMLFYQNLYGNPLPSAPYNSIKMSTIWSWDIFIKNGVWGLLFDQEFGLFLYSPLYIFIFGGLFLKLKNDFLGAIFWLLMFLSVYIPAAGFTLKWYGSWSPMGRYLVVLVPLFSEIIAFNFNRKLSYSHCWTLLLIFLISCQFSSHLLSHYDLWIGAASGESKLLGSFFNSVQITGWFPALISPDKNDYLLLIFWVLWLLTFNWLFIRSSKNINIPNEAFSSEMSSRRSDKERTDHIINHSPRFMIWSVSTLSILFITSAILNVIASQSLPLANSKISFAGTIENNRIVISSKAENKKFQQSFINYKYPTRRISRGDLGSPDYILSGPYITLPSGIYEVVFRFKLFDIQQVDEFVSIDVCTMRGHKILTSRIITSNDFGGSLKQEFSLYIELQEATPNIETRVFSLRKVDFEIEEIIIRTNKNLQLLWQGRILANKKFFRHSLDKFKQVKTENQYLQVVYKEIALLYQQLDETSEALLYFKKYCSLQPQDHETMQIYGELLLTSGRRSEGIKVLQNLQIIQ